MVLAHNIREGLRTQDVQISEDVTFDSMLLTPNTLEGLTHCGFYKPSPIQLHGIPLGKCGFDLLLEAKSGTGKTAVFTVIALEKLDLVKGLQAIILTPTREIAAQICDVITQIGSKFTNLNVQVVIGGLPLNEDIIKFKNNVHIVVGSPGRLRHLIQANHIDASAVRLLVLDEADKLMDRSFQSDINYIFSVLPKEKQVIMSSATYPELIKSTMCKYIQNAQHICPDSTTVLIGIKQLISTVKSNSNIVRQTQNRFEELLKILSNNNFKQCLIFCNYQVRVKDLNKMLQREKWPAEKLHSQQDQTDRLDALKMLQDYKCRILISTDLAARGIDASNIDLVINFEPPYEWQTYLHRIGRAGRFGSYGVAVTILSEGQEESKFKKMLQPINGILSLKNVWDEEQIDLDESISSSSGSLTQQDIEKSDAYTALLNKLTYGDDNNKYTDEAESFESLCQSLEKTKENEIESFNDLLTSFTCYKKSNCDVSYNHFNGDSKCENTPTLNVLNDINLKLNIDTEIENHLKILRDKLGNDSQKTIMGKFEKRVQSMNRDITNELLTNTETELYDLELDNGALSKALLDAGLPTSFGSKKNHNKKKVYSTYLNNINKTDTIPQSTTHKYNEVEGNRSPKGRKICKSVEIEQKSYKWTTDYSFTGLISDESIKKSLNNISENKYKHNNSSQISDHTMKKNRNINTKYTLWHSQLKQHIQQIQMFLYIEELSKL